MVLIIAHRGASGRFPENSVQAFKQALSMGADAVEFDVRLTKDRKIVVSHDPGLKIGNGSARRIRELTLKQVRGLAASGETAPTIQEALDFLSGKCICKIDLKEDRSFHIEDIIVEER